MEFPDNELGGMIYDGGIKLYNTGKYEKALTEFKKAAQVFHHPDSQFQIGFMYDVGKGVAADFEQAIVWYKRAASTGHKVAQYNVGISCRIGRGVDINYKQAMLWFKMAESQGIVDAQLQIGLMYNNGEGVPIDIMKTLQWMQKAADNNDISAKYYLSLAYQNGLGVIRDDEKALKWLTESAEGGIREAIWLLGFKYMNGFGVTQDHVKAIYWLRKISHAITEANLCIVYMYDNKLCAKQDYQKAKENLESKFNEVIRNYMCELAESYLIFNDLEKSLYWFKRAAKTNNVRALLSIGVMNLIGLGVGKKNIEKAYSYLSRAANLTQVPLTLDQLKPQGNDNVQEGHKNYLKWYIKLLGDRLTTGKECVSGLSCFGYLYYKGLGVPKDFTFAKKQYVKVLSYIDDSDTDANMCMGLLYSKGLGVEQDFEIAMSYFKRSAKSINTYAYNLIGDAYKFGKGVEKNYAVAMKWYMKGDIYKDEYSQFNIGKMHLNGFGVAVNISIALEWFQKAYNNGCREASSYINYNQNLNSDNLGRSNHIDQLLTAERTARKAAEEELIRLKTELALMKQVKAEDNSVNTKTKKSYQFFHLDDISTVNVEAKKSYQFFHLDDTSTVNKSTNVIHNEISATSRAASSLTITSSSVQVNTSINRNSVKNNVK